MTTTAASSSSPRIATAACASGGWRSTAAAAKQITSEAIGRHRVGLSSDDKWIYYDNTRGESRRVSIDGGEGEPVFTADIVAKLSEPMPRGFHEAWPSPDGAFMAGHFQTPTR